MGETQQGRGRCTTKTYVPAHRQSVLLQLTLAASAESLFINHLIDMIQCQTLLCDFVQLIEGDFLPDCYVKFLGAVAFGPAREFAVIDKSLAPLGRGLSVPLGGSASPSVDRQLS